MVDKVAGQGPETAVRRVQTTTPNQDLVADSALEAEEVVVLLAVPFPEGMAVTVATPGLSSTT